MNFEIVYVQYADGTTLVMRPDLTCWEQKPGGSKVAVEYSEAVKRMWEMFQLTTKGTDCEGWPRMRMDLGAPVSAGVCLWPDGRWTAGVYGGRLTTREVLARFETLREQGEKSGVSNMYMVYVSIEDRRSKPGEESQAVEG